MNETLNYMKYGLVGSVPGFFIAWGDVGMAFILGFVGAIGGFLAKLLSNYLKKRFKLGK